MTSGKNALVKLTDHLLRDEIAQGLTAPQIAAKYGISRQAVHARVKRLELTTTAVAVVAPTESRRFVNHQLDAMEQLAAGLARVNKLMDACDAWLQDPDNPDVYDIGPRANEVTVVYWEAGDESLFRAKAPLSKLLARIDKGGILTIEAESKFADPRKLILETVQEARQTVTTAVELARLLADAKAMQQFRDALLSEIAKVSPDVAQNIAEAVRSVHILYAASGGSESLAS